MILNTLVIAYYFPEEVKCTVFNKSKNQETKVPVFKTDKELLNWMKNNIEYKTFRKLMSAEDVEKEREGSCHDQTMFAMKHLKQIPGIDDIRAYFIIEQNSSTQVCGDTHSVVVYRKGQNYYYIENAWRSHRGIWRLCPAKQPFNQDVLLDHIKKYSWVNHPAYDLIHIGIFKGTPGMGLQDIVDVSFNTKAGYNNG